VWPAPGGWQSREFAGPISSEAQEATRIRRGRRSSGWPRTPHPDGHGWLTLPLRSCHVCIRKWAEVARLFAPAADAGIGWRRPVTRNARARPRIARDTTRAVRDCKRSSGLVCYEQMFSIAGARGRSLRAASRPSASTDSRRRTRPWPSAGCGGSCREGIPGPGALPRPRPAGRPPRYWTGVERVQVHLAVANARQYPAAECPEGHGIKKGKGCRAARRRPCAKLTLPRVTDPRWQWPTWGSVISKNCRPEGHSGDRPLV
jgi:hypothetical protein